MSTIEFNTADTGGTGQKAWYVLKVQSSREDTIREALEKRIKIFGLEPYFGQIIVPTERVVESKGGKRKVTERKFYPGYIMIEMELNERTWFLVHETPGVGDFVGSGGQPVPMSPHEVEKMLGQAVAKEEESPRLKIDFEKGEQVKIKEGPFENFEGTIEEVLEAKGIVKVIVTIFNRPTLVELEYWQVERV